MCNLIEFLARVFVLHELVAEEMFVETEIQTFPIDNTMDSLYIDSIFAEEAYFNEIAFNGINHTDIL